MNDIIQRTCFCINELIECCEILKKYGFDDKENREDYLDLFPDDKVKMMRGYKWLTEPEEETVEEDDNNSQTSRKGCNYNRMKRSDIKDLCKYIASNYDGVKYDQAIVEKIYEYMNQEFGRASIRDLLRGRTFPDISSSYFKMENCIIKAI